MLHPYWMLERVRVRKNKELKMLTYKIKNFLKPESLDMNDQMYLITKRCSCNACVGFSEAFSKTCSKEKLDYLNSKK